MIRRLPTSPRPPHLGFELQGPLTAFRAHVTTIGQWMGTFARLLEDRGYPMSIETSRPTRGAYTAARWERTTAAMASGQLVWVALQPGDMELDRGILRLHRGKARIRGEPLVRRTGRELGRAESIDDAEKIAQSNPYISSIRVYEVMSK